jgi:hypothetical protein
MEVMGFDTDFTGLVIALAALAVFGIWKLIELIVWIFNHVSIT